jgi:hypothetical protein
VPNRLNSRVASLLVLGVCLEAGSGESSAQQAVPHETNRDLARACSLLSNPRACVERVEAMWDSFAKTLVTAVVPSRRIIWDGNWRHPNAPAFYALRGQIEKVKLVSGATFCGPGRPNEEQFIHLTCTASRELAASGRNQWPTETAQFRQFKQQLVAARCLPPVPEDTCSLIKPTVADASPSATDVALFDEDLAKGLGDPQ